MRKVHILIIFLGIYCIPNRYLVNCIKNIIKFRIRSKCRHHALNPVVFQDKWWEEGLPFTCTGCGKCCQNDGEVWFDTDEFYDLSLLLDKAFEDTINEYMETISFGWLKAKNKISNDGYDSCVFLSPDGKTCTVYKARPTQCRTYPYWPDLLVNKSTWDAEAVVPDMMVGKHWTKEGGGCEGINHPDALIMPKTVISRNQDLYKRYTNQYTLSPSIQLSSDRNRLISKLEVIKGVSKSIVAWVNDFALAFKLPLFSMNQPSFLNNLRYRVFFGDEPAKIIAKLNYEILVLLTEKEEDVSAILLILPFAFSSYEKFMSFEREWTRVRQRDEHQSKQTFMDSKSKSLIRRVSNKKGRGSDSSNRSKNSNNDIMASSKDGNYSVSFYHPLYGQEDSTNDEKEWLEDEDDITTDIVASYARRTPFPTLLISRGPAVKNRKAEAECMNELTKVGEETLRKKLEDFIRMSVGY